tara:strand:+ start:57891 stop:58103 length:213 start_codon:yes stop_codon:yes gene_type:complete
MQTKKQSLKESLLNVLIGFTISLMASFIIFPLFNMESSVLKNIGTTICFTIVSLMRSYLIRRYFNNKEKL